MLKIQYLEEVPRNPCTREEFERTLRIIGGKGNYLTNSHLACRTRMEQHAACGDDGKWRK